MSLVRTVRVALAMGLCALAAPLAAQAPDADGARLKAVLEGQFLAGVPHQVKAAEAVGGGPLGFVVEVPVNREDADEGAHQRRLQATKSKLTAQALSLLERAFPGRSVASWSTVELVDAGTALPPAPAVEPRGAPWGGLIDGDALGAQVVASAKREAPRGPRPARKTAIGVPIDELAALDGSKSPKRAVPATLSVEPVVAGVEARGASGDVRAGVGAVAHANSAAPKLADRLRRELAPIYPDARVEVLPRGGRKVELWVTILTPQPSSANGPVIVDYVKRVCQIVCGRDFPELEVVGGPNVGIRPLDDPDGDDLRPRDNASWRSRQPRERVGLSRALEGRMRQELSLRFTSVQVSVSFVGPSEAIFEVRCETPGALTRESLQLQREYLRRTALTILGNEHPGIKLSARSKFSVWTREPGSRQGDRGAGSIASVSVSAPIRSLRSRVIELPTAHVLHPGARQVEVQALHRTVKDGLFSNVASYDLTGVEAAYRQGIARRFEGALTYSTYTSDVGVRTPGTFVAESLGQGVVTAAVKYMPVRRDSVELTVGGAQSLVAGLDRAHFLPDEWQKFSNVFAALSTPFAPGWRATATILRGFIPAAGGGRSATVDSAGLALEYRAFEEVRLAGEIVSETLDGVRIGELGVPVVSDGETVYDNLHFNAAATFGIDALGDVSVYARKLNLDAYRELGLSLFSRF